MRRTQISLDDWQYESLKVAADREDRSLASVVREAVTIYLGHGEPRERGSLLAIDGIGEDTEARGRDHDELLYGGGSE